MYDLKKTKKTKKFFHFLLYLKKLIFIYFFFSKKLIILNNKLKIHLTQSANADILLFYNSLVVKQNVIIRRSNKNIR